jgi:hypothetical protein
MTLVLKKKNEQLAQALKKGLDGLIIFSAINTFD